MPSIVLFEDHTVRRFRPLSDSTPVSELCCGMFSLRERLSLLTGEGGALRLREELAPLATDPAWPTAGDGARRTLWVSGRVAPSFGQLAALLAAAAEDFLLVDDAGPLAASLGPELGTQWAASWAAWRDGSPAGLWAPPVPTAWEERGSGPAGALLAPKPMDVPAALMGEKALQWIWELVPRTAAALAADVAWLGDRPWHHRPWGLVSADSEPGWQKERTLMRGGPLPAHVHGLAPENILLGPDLDLGAGVVLDASRGPVVLDRAVSVEPHAFLQGPLFLGDGSRVKAGARLYGESSFGIGNRLAGEIGESTCGPFVNKQHDGFLGHAVLGAWINLGAMTTCSDLKNNYGPVRVDLGEGAVDSGQRFVGLLAGDHVKTAIGTMFNTGTVVGFATNVFGGGMPPKHLPPFRWGGSADAPGYDVERALAVAATVMDRRDCRLTGAHENLFRHLAQGPR